MRCASIGLEAVFRAQTLYHRYKLIGSVDQRAIQIENDRPEVAWKSCICLLHHAGFSARTM